MPKATSSRAAAAARRHNPLADDITSAGHLRTQSSKKGKRRSQGDDEDGENEQRFIDAKMSRKILQIGQELAEEDAAEQKLVMDSGPRSNAAFEFDTRFDEEPTSDDEKFENDEWVDEEVEEVVRALQDRLRSIRYLLLLQEIDPNDLDMFNKFMPGHEEDPIFHPREPDSGGQTTNLADLILEKIAEHEAKQAGESAPFIQGGGLPEDAVQIPAKAVEVYEKYVT